MIKNMSFKRVLLSALFMLCAAISSSAYSNDSINVVNEVSIETVEVVNDSSETTIIEDVIEAIIYVESRGNLKAVNGSCCGPMQISPGMVKECNKILKEQGSSKRFTLSDRFKLEESKEMFRLFNKRHNPSFNMEKAIRSWNGGLGYKIKSTQSYYNKVMKRLSFIRSSK